MTTLTAHSLSRPLNCKCLLGIFGSRNRSSSNTAHFTSLTVSLSLSLSLSLSVRIWSEDHHHQQSSAQLESRRRRRRSGDRASVAETLWSPRHDNLPSIKMMAADSCWWWWWCSPFDHHHPLEMMGGGGGGDNGKNKAKIDRPARADSVCLQ